MATAPPPAASKSPTVPDRLLEYDDYIDQQIAKTSLHVKSVDIANSLLGYSCWAATSLLGVVVIDHWLLDLGVPGRWLVFGSLSLFTLLVLARLIRLLWKQINPAFAAQTVERSFPELKNGLLNFLLLRHQEPDLDTPAFRLVRQQAATGLAQHPIDVAVDRSSVIRLGYGLIAIATVWSLYLLLSPKSPAQTLHRVLLPWSDTPRPSRVDILSVTPGDVDRFRGQKVDITVEAVGLGENDSPILELSTLDGQLDRQPIEMSKTSVPGRYVGVLPAGETGLLQSVEYRIHAGDAFSRPYQVTVREAPQILVERVEYEFPSYTNLPAEIVSGTGDLRAIEGTRVTIHAAANQSIASGRMELLLPRDTRLMSQVSQQESTQSNVEKPTERSKSIPLSTEGNRAQAPLMLRLNDDRIGPIYRGYRLHFLNEQNVASEGGVEHTIEVLPDLKPIVEILLPTERTIEVPQNGSQEIEIRALDPDFQLERATLLLKVNGRDSSQFPLIKEAVSGPWNGKFRFRPTEHHLQAGDIVEYVVKVEDNRHAPVSRLPEPNQSLSIPQFLKIVAPVSNPTSSSADTDSVPPPGDTAIPTDPDNTPGNQGTDSQTTDSQTPDSRTESNPASESSPSGSNSKGEDPPARSQGETGPNPEKNPEKSPQDDPSDQRNEEHQEESADNPSAMPQPRQDSSPNPPEQKSQPPQGKKSSEPGLKKNGQSNDQAEADDLSSGTPGESQENSDSEKSGPNGGGSQANSPSSSARSQGGAGNSSSANSTPNEPLPSDGSRDGEVIERIRDHLNERKENQPKNLNSEQQHANSPRDGESGVGKEQQGQNTRNTNSSSPQSSSDSAADGGDSTENADTENSSTENHSTENADNQESKSTNAPDKNPSQRNSAERNSPQRNSPERNSAERDPSDNNVADESPSGGQPDGNQDPSKILPRSNNKTPRPEKGTPSSANRGQKDREGRPNPGGREPSQKTETNKGTGGRPKKEDADAGPTDSRSATNPPDAQSSDTQSPDTQSPDTQSPDTRSSETQAPDSSPGSAQPSEVKTPATSPSAGNRPDRPADQRRDVGKQGDKKGADPTSDPTSDSDRSPELGSDPGRSGGGKSESPQDGRPSDGQRPAGSSAGTASTGESRDRRQDVAKEPGGDAANLEYARQTTDLVLEYLRDQERSPDPELMDKLGWSPEDVQRFLQRWQRLKDESQDSADSSPKPKLDDILKGMGLRQPTQGRQQGFTKDDQQHGNRESGIRRSPPSDIDEAYRRFLRSLQRPANQLPSRRTSN